MKLPVVVLTGFLGAGKTTLLNRVLAARAAAGEASGKLAIVVNELGTIGVDAELLPRGAARQVELPGGCVCCVLNDALDAAIGEILEANPGLEMLILETTGVAEPVPIVWTLERPPLASRLRVAAVVTLVDPTSWVAARATSVAAEIQVESADVVLVTKGDVAAPDEQAAALAAIAALAPAVPVLALGGDEAAAWLLATLRDPPERGTPREIDHAGHDHAGPDGDHAGHDHAPDGAVAGRAHGVDSVALAIEATVELEAFEEAVAALPAAFFRVKAIVHAIDGRTGGDAPGWAAVHRVGLRVSSEPIEAPRGSGRVVGLGPGVTAAPLAACVAAAVLGSSGDRDAAR
jgi:G3E family GTPase